MLQGGGKKQNPPSQLASTQGMHIIADIRLYSSGWFVHLNCSASALGKKVKMLYLVVATAFPLNFESCSPLFMKMCLMDSFSFVLPIMRP